MEDDKKSMKFSILFCFTSVRWLRYICQNIKYSDYIQMTIFQPLIVFYIRNCRCRVGLPVLSTNLYSLKFANLLRLQSWNLFSPSALNLSDSMSISEWWNQVINIVRSGPVWWSPERIPQPIERKEYLGSSPCCSTFTMSMGAGRHLTALRTACNRIESCQSNQWLS